MAYNPLVTGKFFWEFLAQIYRTGVLYDQTDRVKGIFHEINSSLHVPVGTCGYLATKYPNTSKI
jgi:hypothetical protein